MKHWIWIFTGVVATGALATLYIDRYVPIRCPVSRVDAEIHAFCAALELYKETNGEYPSSPATETLSPEHSPDPAEYIASSQFLYRVLSGDSDGNPDTSSPEDGKLYFDFRNQMIRRTANGDCYVIDPWGNPYGYSTLKAKHPESSAGHNTLFDLWSTGGGNRVKDRKRWTTNW